MLANSYIFYMERKAPFLRVFISCCPDCNTLPDVQHAKKKKKVYLKDYQGNYHTFCCCLLNWESLTISSKIL